MNINIAKNTIAAFDDVFYDIQKNGHTNYWLKGGRGSTKSSFVSIIVPLLIMQHPSCHAVIMRKVGITLRNSVYNQIQWALDTMGISHLFQCRTSPLTITYKETGQQLLFFGVDDKSKIKSIKLPFGYVGTVWYEELDQFAGMEEIRNLNQSLLRGGDKFWCFYTFNPPKSKDNWVNHELLYKDKARLVKHTTYFDVPKEWLGEQFYIDAQTLKDTRENLYNHEYLGEVIGTGGNVFENVTLRKIAQEEINEFDNLRRGLDWGFSRDPFAYVTVHYERARQRIFIFHENYGLSINNRKASQLIKASNSTNNLVICDSSEPKSIHDLREESVNAIGVKKDPGSRERGMRFLADELLEIIIDPERCPNAAREFVGYEYRQDRFGNFISEYPKENDHTIDAVRYALSEDMTSGKARVAFRID